MERIILTGAYIYIYLPRYIDLLQPPFLGKQSFRIAVNSFDYHLPTSFFTNKMASRNIDLPAAPRRRNQGH